MTLTDSSATRNLVLSVILTLSIISIAWALGSMKSSPLIPATTLLSADYQMESAIIMQMQQLRQSGARQPQSMHKEIMPGITMHLEVTRQTEKNWLFKAEVKGMGIDRSMQAVADSNNPDKIVFIR